VLIARMSILCHECYAKLRKCYAKKQK